MKLVNHKNVSVYFIHYNLALVFTERNDYL